MDNHKKYIFRLVSDGGVHSHTSIYEIDATQDYGLKDVYVHAFTDGRDVDPKSGKNTFRI
jgi:2,3-bisphosphoglycerate-independent phosphoglycerate mutase